MLNSGFQGINDLKENGDEVKAGLSNLLNAMVNENEEVLADVHPLLKVDYKKIKKGIKQQKDENEQMLKQLIIVRKETHQMRQQIEISENRIAFLEKELIDTVHKHMGQLMDDKSEYEYEKMDENYQTLNYNSHMSNQEEEFL